MEDFELKANGLSKNFVKNVNIFSDFNINFKNGDVIGLIGDNGSGKSTLLKILAGVLSSGKGNIELKVGGNIIDRSKWNKHYSFVAPYVNLYEEFNPYEHYKVVAALRNIVFDEAKLDKDLKLFKLLKHKFSQIKGFSSGMKQRFKFILASQINPLILFLDEPTSNLDEDGIRKVNDLITNQYQSKGALVIATNEERERALCNQTFNIMDYKIGEQY